MKEYYQVTPAGNWEHGMNILHSVTDGTAFLAKHNLNATEWAQQLDRNKKVLLEERASRVRPGLDDKILTAWNAMMTCGLLDAYAALGDIEFKQIAEASLRFLETHLCEDTTLYRSYKGKRSSTHGFLDDYAWYILALTRYYQVTFDESALMRAVEFTRVAISEFYDPQERYFFYTSGKAERLIARKKEIFDNVIPSSNAIMAQNLHWLGTMMSIDEWIKLSENLIAPLQSLIASEPSYMSQWAIAMTEAKKGLKEVVLAGPGGTHHQTLLRTFLPFAAYMKSSGKAIIPLAKDKVPLQGKDTVYVCYKRVCQLPVHDINAAIEQIKA